MSVHLQTCIDVWVSHQHFLDLTPELLIYVSVFYSALFSQWNIKHFGIFYMYGRVIAIKNNVLPKIIFVSDAFNSYTRQKVSRMGKKNKYIYLDWKEAQSQIRKCYKMKRKEMDFQFLISNYIIKQQALVWIWYVDKRGCNLSGQQSHQLDITSWHREVQLRKLPDSSSNVLFEQLGHHQWLLILLV